MTSTRSHTVKFSRTDSAWRTCPQPWGISREITHRIAVIATPDGGVANHGLTECGLYLLRVRLYFEPPADANECDACLMGDTEYHVVYTYRDPSGQPIYVGSTSDLLARIQCHATESTWWVRDLTLTYTVHATEIEAREAETRAIAELKPLHNFRPRVGKRPLADSKATLHVRREVLARFVADVLGQPVGSFPDSAAAGVLGVAGNTYWRVRTDPDYTVSGGFVAQLITTFGAESLPELLEARPQRVLAATA